MTHHNRKAQFGKLAASNGQKGHGKVYVHSSLFLVFSSKISKTWAHQATRLLPRGRINKNKAFVALYDFNSYN